MKTKILLINIFILFSFLISCDKQEVEEVLDIPDGKIPEKDELPEGYFQAHFIPSSYEPYTKTAVTGSDSRIQYIHYVIYKSTGEYVKERIILTSSQGVPTWPLPIISDTLPKGSYKVVFFGNIEKTLFPYATSGSPVNYNDVLVNYQTSYGDARIILPPAEFANNTEYYWANASFSDTSPNPSILLQRVIGTLRLHRNFVDTNNAVEKLVQNITIQINYRNIIKTALIGVQANHSDGLLYQPIRTIIQSRLIGASTALVDSLLNHFVLDLADPITDTLLNQLKEKLVPQLELALAANATGGEGGLAYLGRILNPWAYGTESIVTIDNFPKSIDLDLGVKENFPLDQKFRYSLKTDVGGTVNDRYIAIKGFNGDYNVKKIDILAQGLVAGLVIDQVIGSELLLPGAFMDITDPLSGIGDKSNRRYRADYSFLDLYLKSYTQQMGGSHSLTLSVTIGSVANINGILNGTIDTVKQIPIIGPILSVISGAVINLIFSDIRSLIVSVPVNLPLLGIDNLEISGSWSPVTAY